MEDHKKLQVVQEFLTEVYGEEKPPLFEVNSMTVSKLYNLASKRKKAIAEDKIILEYNKILAKEYSVQASQTANKLKAYGFPLENLPPPLVLQLNNLAEIGVQLGLKDFKLSSFLLALSDLQQRIKNLTQDLEKEQKNNSLMENRTKEAVSLLGEAQQARSALGAAFEEQQKQSLVKFEANQQYLTSKRAEYEAKHADLKIEFVQAHLDALGATQEIRHSTLVERSFELENISKELESKSKLLQTFLDLPPDEKLARKKIADARQRLAQLEDQLSRGIGDLQL